jgi:site-specific recombinase XerD
VLYQERIPRPWARPWPCRAQAVNSGRGLAHGKPFRDEVSSKEVDTRHQAVLSRLRTEIRARHYSLPTEQAYAHWIQRFMPFRSLKSPQELGPEAVKEYLEFLAEERQISAGTQDQALNALMFLYEQVLGEPLKTIGDFTRAKRPRRLPVVLTREQVKRLPMNSLAPLAL